MSKNGLPLIKQFESCRLTAYRDIVGVWTIGWGDTTNVRPGMIISQAEADARLMAAYNKIEDEVLLLVNVPLNENQLGALVSFSYNLGVGALGKSTLRKKIEAHDPTAADEFQKWDFAGGKQVPGLLRRRLAEAKLFKTPV